MSARVSVEGNTGERRRLDGARALWALPVVPWLWYVVRGIHARMDQIAIALPVLVLGAAGLALYVSITRASLNALAVFGSLVLFFFVAVVSPWRPQSGPTPEQPMRIATVNTGLYWFSDNDIGFLVNQEMPDLVVGVELAESHDAELQSRFEFTVTDILPLERQQQNERELEPDDDTYRRNGLPSIGVYSNRPMTPLDDPLADTIDGGLPGFRLQVDTDSGPVVVYALHIPRPLGGDGAYELHVSDHLAMVEQVADAIDRETLPTIVVGDLNSVDRGQGYRRLTSTLTDAMRQNAWAVPTTDRALPFSLLFARIDHVLMSTELCATNGRSINTRYADHRPLIVDVGFCPAGAT